MQPIISVRELGKAYKIRQSARKKYHTLRDDLTETVQRLFQGKLGQRQTETFWAIQDINFDVYPGDVMGIIGRNGAGKSTLLKILSRITSPTTGEAILRGRVASLLEIGTGFHPELTGRENIFMSAAVLGMTQREIRQKLDEIIAFAEVEKFLDTPVKRYSSGMYVRLAFSVAAHLEPEILIVDEVLAVGDVAFQRKCLGRMQDVANGGRTVLFVSHNTQAIRALCTRGLVLHKGQVIGDEGIEKALHLYNRVCRGSQVDAITGIHNHLHRRGSGKVRFTDIQMADRTAQARMSFEIGEPIQFHLAYEVFEPVAELFVSITLRSGTTHEFVTSIQHPISLTPLPAGHQGRCTVTFPDPMIRPGEYPLYFWLGSMNQESLDQAFDVVDSLTDPLVINPGEPRPDDNFDRSLIQGYFSIPSSIHFP